MIYRIVKKNSSLNTFFCCVLTLHLCVQLAFWIILTLCILFVRMHLAVVFAIHFQCILLLCLQFIFNASYCCVCNTFLRNCVLFPCPLTWFRCFNGVASTSHHSFDHFAFVMLLDSVVCGCCSPCYKNHFASLWPHTQLYTAVHVIKLILRRYGRTPNCIHRGRPNSGTCVPRARHRRRSSHASMMASIC